MSDIVGIDFGTSTCKMVRYEQGELERVRFGGATTTMPELLPSYISFHEDEVRDAGEMGTIIVGGTAKAEALLRFEATYPSSSPGHEPIKINITSSDEDFTPYRPTHTELFDRTLYRAPDMAVEIFSYMMNMGAEYLGYQPGSAVLTVPAYFSNEQFAAIREAAQEAGLHVEDRVPEPVAAAVSYAWRRGLQGNVLVYDFGGGTFDTTVIGVSDSQYEVYAKLGNPELGGTDLDRILYNTLFRSWGEDVTGWASLSQDPDAPDRDDAEVNTARQQLADAAEQAKIELSSAEEVSKNITLLAASGEQITRTLTLTRSDLEAQIGHLIRGTFDTVQRVIQKAGMRNEDIDHVLPVGGVTRMPLIRDSLARDFGPDKICIPNSPDTAVAEGAALVAARDEIGLNPTVKDVLGLSLRMQKPESIETSVVIPSGTSIEDCEKTIRFRWGSASKYEVNLCEGENLEYHENEPIGYLLLEPGQELARGTEVRTTIRFNQQIDGYEAVANVVDSNVPITAQIVDGEAHAEPPPPPSAPGAEIVICIDVSTSFRRTFFQDTCDSCLQLEKALKERDFEHRFALVFFADSEVPGQQPTKMDFTSIDRMLERGLASAPEYDGGDEPEEVSTALQTVLRLLSTATEGSARTVLLFTDAPPKNRERVASMATDLAGKQAEIHVFGPGVPIVNEYLELAETTGGNYLDIAEDLQRGIDEVVRRLTGS